MDAVISELVKQLPSAIAIVLVVYLFLAHEERIEQRRTDNAKQRSEEMRAHDRAKDEMFVTSIKSLIAKQDETFKLITDALNDHELSSKERYQKIGVTQELIKRASSQRK